MKGLLLALGTTLLISACGSANQSATESTSDLDSRRNRMTTSFFANDLVVAAINGGINSSVSAYAVEGKIHTGGNRCQAQGVRASVRQVVVGRELHVIPMITQPRGIESRMCTREFMPQYETVKFQVRADSARIDAIIVKQVEGRDRGIEEFLKVSEVIGMNSLVISPVQGGINPDFFGRSIRASVMLGGNPCVASGASVELVQERVGDTIQVKAVRTVTNPFRMCTMEFNPVEQVVELQIRASRKEVKAIHVMNVDAMGAVHVHTID